MGVTKEQLQDGRVLSYLIHQFVKEPNKDNLILVMRCLRDSDVWVPMTVEVSKEDQKKLDQAQRGEEVSTKEPIRLKPFLYKMAVSVYLCFQEKKKYQSIIKRIFLL